MAVIVGGSNAIVPGVSLILLLIAAYAVGGACRLVGADRIGSGRFSEGDFTEAHNGGTFRRQMHCCSWMQWGTA